LIGEARYSVEVRPRNLRVCGCRRLARRASGAYTARAPGWSCCRRRLAHIVPANAAMVKLATRAGFTIRRKREDGRLLRLEK
jgi:hypothetical protein